MDLEPSHGTSLALHYLKLGKTNEAVTIFQMTELSCMNKGVYEFDDPEYAKSMLIATLAQGKDLTPDQLKFLANTIIRANEKEGNQKQETIKALESLANNGLIDHSRLSLVKSALEGPASLPIEPRTGIEKMRKMSYNYQGIISNYIGGNFRFGGLLYSSYLNRSDKEVFERLIDTPMGLVIDKDRPLSRNRLEKIEQMIGRDWDQKKMLDIEDPRKLMAVLDLFTRQSFFNEELELENLNSPGHKIFERATDGLFSAGGMEEAEKRKLVDGAGSPIPGSRTNPSAALSLGLGDCRQHAQTKQMLFGSWRRLKINQYLRKGYEHKQSGDDVKASEAFTKAEEFSKMDLRTFDVVVKAPIEMEEKYKPKLNANKHHIVTDNQSYEEVEDHTMNMLFLGDEVYFADSFYQDHDYYHWGDGEVDLRTMDTKGVIYAGDIEAEDNAGNLQGYPIHLVPTPYAGKRDTYQRGSGETFILGIPTEIDILHSLNPRYRDSRFQLIQSFAS